MLKLKNMNEKRFVDHDTSVEDYVESLENRNTKEKTKRDVKLLETFLRNEKNDEREVQDIEPAELNKHLAEFIRSVLRRKDGEDYEPSSLSGCPPKIGLASLGSPVNLSLVFCGWKGLNEEWLKSN